MKRIMTSDIASERTGHSTGFYRGMLLAVAVIWGSSFLVMKGAVTMMPVNFLLTGEFFIAALVLTIIFRKQIRANLTWAYAWRGLVLGIVVYAAYFFQTFGLTDTTPSKSVFLTIGYVVMVPFMYWALGHGRPDRFSIVAAVTLLAGVGLIILEGDLSVRFGDWMTVICAVCFAIQMVLTAHFVQGRDPAVLTVWLLFGAGVLSLIATLTMETPPPLALWSPFAIFAVLYLAIVVTAIGFLWQTTGQKHVSPAAASVLLSLESIFGTAFSIVFYGEVLTAKIALGFVLVFVAVIVSETKLSFLRKRTINQPENL